MLATPLFLMLYITHICYSQHSTGFTKTVITVEEWNISDKVASTAKSAVHCGVICMMKYKKDKSCTAITYEENTGLCTTVLLAYVPKGLRIAWASSFASLRKPFSAIDRNYETGSWDEQNIFLSKQNHKHPWFAVDLLVPKNITQVKIVERKDHDAYRTNNIEVRIGNSKPFSAGTNGNTIMTSNTVCGFFEGPGIVNQESAVKCLAPIVGRYITLQRNSSDTEPINWSEIRLVSTPIVEDEMEVLKMDVSRNHSLDVCAKNVGYSECPSTHQYAYKQGRSCCQVNIDFDKHTTPLPLLYYDSSTCQDFSGADRSTACVSPRCVNHGCRPYQCYMNNIDLSGGEFFLFQNKTRLGLQSQTPVKAKP